MIGGSLSGGDAGFRPNNEQNDLSCSTPTVCTCLVEGATASSRKIL